MKGSRGSSWWDFLISLSKGPWYNGTHPSNRGRWVHHRGMPKSSFFHFYLDLPHHIPSRTSCWDHAAVFNEHLRFHFLHLSKHLQVQPFLDSSTPVIYILPRGLFLYSFGLELVFTLFLDPMLLIVLLKRNIFSWGGGHYVLVLEVTWVKI
jgi:hypothetical protein